MTKSLDGVTHGKRSTYIRGCRCTECRAANASRARKDRESRRKRLDTAEFEHGASAYGNWGCRCEVCTAAWVQKCAPATTRWRQRNPEKVREKSRRWQESNPELVAQWSRQNQAKRQAETLEKAGRHYYRWTGDELELASRKDLTNKEVALMIGRSYHAVRNMRVKLRDLAEHQDDDGPEAA